MSNACRTGKYSPQNPTEGGSYPILQARTPKEKYMKTNIFRIAVVGLFVGATIWEFLHGRVKMGLFFLFSAAINYVVGFMK